MSVNESNASHQHSDIVVRKAESGWVVGDENVSDLTSAMVLADLFAADQVDSNDTTIMEAVDEHGAPRGPRSQSGSAQARPAQSRPAQSQPAQSQPAQSPPAQSPPAQSPPAQSPPAQPGPGRPAAPQPRENGTGPQQRITAVGPGIKDSAADEVSEAARLAVTVAQLEHALAARVRVEQAIGVLAERHRLRPREAFDLLRKASRSRGVRVTEMAQDVVASTANPLLLLPDELSRQVPVPDARPRNRSLRRTPGRHAAER
jgi:ANTAR domain